MDDTVSIWIVVAVFWMAFGVGSAVIANSKGRNPAGYFFLGFFLGIIGLIITIVMPPLRPARAEDRGERFRAVTSAGLPWTPGRPSARTAAHSRTRPEGLSAGRLRPPPARLRAGLRPG